MNPYLASTLAYGAAAAAAALLAFAPKDSRADDITIDTTPFVSTKTRAEVRGDYIKAPSARASTEWSSQMNEQHPYKSSLTRSDARSGYLHDRQEVSQYNGEDSGSYLLSHPRRDPTRAMGAGAR